VKVGQQTITYGTIGNSALTRLWQGVPVILGPGIAAGAILWVHGVGLTYKTEDYATAPPTISRALLDPGIAGPFAIAMIASAFFLAIAIFQVALLLYRNLKLIGQDTACFAALLPAAVTCEIVAIAGMVVMSQFTGNVNSTLHNIGSYMLFFGHAIGISLAGFMIRGVLIRLTGQDQPPGTAASTWLTLHRFPRRSGWVAILSFLYGVVYFGGKFLPDAFFFWQRTVMSVLEVVVILSFLGFLVAFLPFLRVCALGAAKGDD
jgi:hypothetical protein